MGFTPAELDRRTLHRRAVEAAIWGMPAVNFDAMYQAVVRDAGGGFNQVVYWSRLLDWRNQTLTPNPDAIYLMPFIDTTDEPMVLEIPAAEGGSITGSVDDAWQTAVEDVGLAGVDQGRGGKYLILPPGYEDEVPDGYIAMAAATRRTYGLLRSNLRSGSQEDVAAALAYARRIRLYPISQAANPPPTSFVDAADVVFDATIAYDVRFFEALDRCVQAEPWLTRDKAMIDTLTSLGIEKGKAFTPDHDTQAVLDDAIGEAHAWLDLQYEAAFSPPFYDGTHWALPVSPEFAREIQTGYADPDAYPVDGRGVAYHFAFFSAKHFGAGQFYLFSIKDAEGKTLDGAGDYRLTVPANVPVNLYWSVTICRSLLRTATAARAQGELDSDHARRSVRGHLRFYGPEKPLFDKSWRLPDLQKTDD